METTPHDDRPGIDDLRVITLFCASLPMPLDVPFRHELEGFTVFRSLSDEGDTPLYHLHVGYFANESAAREAVEVIRKYYPFAMVERAPAAGLGSLNDTLNANVEVLRRGFAQLVAPKAVASEATQHYAVLLVRRAATGEAPRIPRLPAFRGFNVYAVYANHEGGTFQEVRLGFFSDLQQAKQFARSILNDFPAAVVLPVSGREHARVIGLVLQRNARSGAGATTADAPIKSESPAAGEPLAD